MYRVIDVLNSPTYTGSKAWSVSFRMKIVKEKEIYWKLFDFFSFFKNIDELKTRLRRQRVF